MLLHPSFPESLKRDEQYKTQQQQSLLIHKTFKCEPLLKKEKNPQPTPKTTAHNILNYSSVLPCIMCKTHHLQNEIQTCQRVSDIWQTDKNATHFSMYNTHASHNIFVIICLVLHCSQQTWGEPHVLLKSSPN